MDPKTRNRINSLIAEANAIARELEDISQGINHEFKGVGANQAKLSLQKVANAYRQLSNEYRKLI